MQQHAVVGTFETQTIRRNLHPEAFYFFHLRPQSHGYLHSNISQPTIDSNGNLIVDKNNSIEKHRDIVAGQ